MYACSYVYVYIMYRYSGSVVVIITEHCTAHFMYDVQLDTATQNKNKKNTAKNKMKKRNRRYKFFSLPPPRSSGRGQTSGAGTRLLAPAAPPAT